MLVVQERTKRMLLEQNIHLEDFGGDVQSVCISALKVNDSIQLLDCSAEFLSYSSNLYQLCSCYVVIIQFC